MQKEYSDLNPYNQPEQLGLEIIKVLKQPNMSYEFNILVSWLHKPTGRVFWKKDSGCSCPMPFETCYFRGPDETNLEEVTENKDSQKSLERVVGNFPHDYDSRQSFIRATIWVLSGKY